jgi:glycosyltransferase involved in cell wall biosynthesis
MPTAERGPSGGATPLLTVVVPCYDEAEVIEQTHRRLVTALSAIVGIAFEIIYVDDGSRDGTLATLRLLHDDEPRVRVLAFARNFGHQTAATAGLDAAAGDAVVLIDADLQDPPEVVAEMVERWRGGADVVYGVRTARDGESAFKRATAALFYRVLGRLSDTRIPVDSGDFRLLDRRVVDVLRAMPERDRFLRGMVAWTGFRQVALPYRRDARRAGRTKYPFVRMLRFAVTGVVSFSWAPLRLAVWLGFTTAALSVVGIVVALYQRLVLQITVPGWAATFIALLFFAGVQLVTIGIIGEYVGRLYEEAKGRPLYVVAERLGFPDDTEPGRRDAGRLSTAERSEPAGGGRWLAR